MHLYKRALILTVLFAFIASTGAIAVSAQTAQTSSPVTATEAVNAVGSATAPTVNPLQLPVASSVSTVNVAATSKLTTLDLLATSQSIKPGVKTQMIVCVLRNGATGLTGQYVTLYVKAGAGSWQKAITSKTGSGGVVGWYINSPKAQTIQYYAVYGGSGSYLLSVSNTIAIKWEYKKTTPYRTYMFAYAFKPVSKKGTNAVFSARLMNGLTPLAGKTVTVWYYNYQTKKFVKIPNFYPKTLATGWVNIGYKSNTAGVAMFKFSFPAKSPYATSESNIVPIQWT